MDWNTLTMLHFFSSYIYPHIAVVEIISREISFIIVQSWILILVFYKHSITMGYNRLMQIFEIPMIFFVSEIPPTTLFADESLKRYKQQLFATQMPLLVIIPNSWETFGITYSFTVYPNIVWWIEVFLQNAVVYIYIYISSITFLLINSSIMNIGIIFNTDRIVIM